MTLKEENVQSYPRPPALEPVAQVLRVELGGMEIARTSRAFRVLETHHAPTFYLPPADIAEGVLVEVKGQTYCEWKGQATYFDVVGGVAKASRAAWCYREPSARFASIRDYVSFYPALMDACYVGSYRVTPQPGDFYGGWVTENLVGVVKGGAGTLHW